MSAIKSQSFLIRDALVFTGHEFVSNCFVLMKDDKITRVGTGDPPSIEDVITIPIAGCTLIPGLIDAHIHALGGNTQAIEQSLRFGVTTVCDMHNEHEHTANLRKLAMDPERTGRYSDFKCAGLGAMIEGGWPEPVVRKEFQHNGHPEIADKMISSWPKLTSPSDAQPFVKSQVEQGGASYIKLMHELGDTVSMALPRPPLEIQKAVVGAAHQQGVIAVGHAFSHAGALDLLEAGADGLTHIFLNVPPNDEWIKTMKERNVHCNLTLSLCASQTGEGNEMQRRFAEDPVAKKMLFDTRPRGNIGLARHCQHASVEHACDNAKALYRAGVPLIVGSDAAGQAIGSAYGMGVHMEMYMMMHGVGMKPAEVLRSATSLTAERFGFRDRGRIEAGAQADLVLVAGDVREVMLDKDVLCLPIKGVWRKGVMADVYQSESRDFTLQAF